MWDALTGRESQEWKRSLWTFPRGSETTGRLRLYKEINPLPTAEPYVTGPIPADWKRVMAALRMGCLPLEVEQAVLGVLHDLSLRKLRSADIEMKNTFYYTAMP